MRKISQIALAGVSLAAMMQPVQAFAQEAADGAEASDEPVIIVEARRRGEDVQDVPLVVQAVSGKDLEQLQIRRFDDVTRAVPGLQLAASQSGVSTTASLRGVNFDANASGSATTVEFYRNDAVITGGALFQAIYDVGQIEVLRGPQGTLRGRASPSGSITLTTKRPDLTEAGGYVNANVSDDSRWFVNGAVNVPVISDKLAVRIAGATGRNRGNQVTGYNQRTNTHDRDIYDRTEALRASVRLAPIDDILVLDFNYETIKRTARQYAQVESFNQFNTAAGFSPVTIEASDRLGVTPTANLQNTKWQIFNWQGQLNLGGQRLTYVGSDVSGRLRANASQDFAGLFTSAVPLASPGSPYIQDTATDVDSTTHEVRLQNNDRVAGMFDYVVGYMKVSGGSPTFLNNITAFASPTSLFFVSNLGLNRYRSDSESSIFGNLTMHLMDRIELSGGAREITFKANSGVQTGTFGAPVSTYVESVPNRRCFGDPTIAGCLPAKKATIYSGSAKFKITDDIMVYGSYGTSWRPGNSVIGFRGTETSAQAAQYLNLPDETSRSWEAGFKSQFMDNRITFNVSVYDQKFENYAFRVSSPVVALNAVTGVTAGTASLASGFNFVAPVAAKIQGMEGQFGFDVNDNLSLGATVAFANGKIANGVFPCLDLNNDNVPDTTLPTGAALFAHLNPTTVTGTATSNQVDTCVGNASPASSSRWSGTFNAEYKMPVGNNEVFLRGFTNWKGDNKGFDLNPYDQVKAFALVDLFAGVRDPDGAWEVSLFAKNLLDTRKVLTRNDSPSTSALRPGTNLAGFGGSGISINSSNATNYTEITTTQPREVGVNLRISFGSR